MWASWVGMGSGRGGLAEVGWGVVGCCGYLLGEVGEVGGEAGAEVWSGKRMRRKGGGVCVEISELVGVVVDGEGGGCWGRGL